MADFLHCNHITLLISGPSIKPHGGLVTGHAKEAELRHDVTIA